MPLTIAYPAAVIPLRRRLVFSALIFGSMLPDLGRLLRIGGHSWHGIFWFCIPVGLLALVVFHQLLKKPLFLLLPESHQRRLLPCMGDFSFFPRRRFLLIVFSLALGAATHMLWDVATDSSGWAVKNVLFFREILFEIPGQPVRVFKLLHHGSTVVGLAIIIFSYFRFLKTAPRHSLHSVFLIEGKMKMVFISLAIGVAVFGAMLFAMVKMDDMDAGGRLQWIEVFALRASIACLVIFGLELLAFSTIFHFWVKEKAEAAKGRN